MARVFAIVLFLFFSVQPAVVGLAEAGMPVAVSSVEASISAIENQTELPNQSETLAGHRCCGETMPGHGKSSGHCAMDCAWLSDWVNPAFARFRPVRLEASARADLPNPFAAPYRPPIL